MMIPVLLLAAALATAMLLAGLLFGRYADRGARLADADQTIAELTEKLEQALAQQDNLTRRVQNLEAIVTSEAWDTFQKKRLPASGSSLALPEEPSDEEKAAVLARRQRSGS